MHCVECGAKIVEGAAFCSNCGKAVVIPQKENVILALETEIYNIDCEIEKQKEELGRIRNLFVIKKQELEEKISLMQDKIIELEKKKEAIDLEEDDEMIPEGIPQEKNDSILHCPNCGTYAPEGIFCGKCGWKLR